MRKITAVIEAAWQPAVLGLVLLAAVLNAVGMNVADLDLWGYLAFGRLFWESRAFPYHDVFSYLPTLNLWVYHEWLTGVLFYPIYLHWGAAGLQLLKLCLCLLTVLFLYLTARCRGADPFSSAIVLWVIMRGLSQGYGSVRAQVFTLAFFALTVFLLENARLKGRWRGLWLLVPLQVLWCNLHGGFLAGLGMTGLYAVGEALQRRRFWPYAGILVLSTLATLINPYGLEYWVYLLRAVAMPRPEIIEWTSVYELLRTGRLMDNCFYILGVVIAVGSLWWWTRWREITAGLALAVTFCLGLQHIRHSVFFLMLLGAYIPKVVSFFSAARRTGRLERNILVVMFVLIVLVNGYNFYSQGPLKLGVPSLPAPGQLYHYPLGAVDFIQRHRLSGKLLCNFNWGEYLLWILHPQCKVALDGRYETVYPDDLCRQFFDFIRGRGHWERFLDKYPPDMILIDVRSPVYYKLQRSPWRQVYADTGSALFIREDKLPPSLLSKAPDA